jgi:gliding motility-associated-like protein
LKSDDVIITFQEPVKALANDITGICLDRDNLLSVDLDGSAIGPFSNAQWINITGNGTIGPTSTSNDDGGVAFESNYQFSQEDYDNGDPIQVKLVVTPANGSCTASEKIIEIHFEKKPISNAGVNIENSCDQNIQLNATAPLSGVASWSTTQAGVTFDDIHDPKTIVRHLPVGKTTLTWSITNSSGVCQTVSSSISITRVALPQVIDLSITECAVDFSSTQIALVAYENSVTSLAPADRTITWYRNESPPSGVLVNNPSAQINITDGQEFVARVHEIRTGCSSDARVIFNVRQPPAVMNTLVSLCENVTGSGLASGINLYEKRFTQAVAAETNISITWHYSQEQAAANTQPIHENIAVHKHQQFFARVVHNDSVACSAIAKLDLLVNSQPNIRTIMGRESVCQGQSSVPGNLPVEVYQVIPQQGAKYHWRIPTDSKFTVFGGGGENDFYILLQFPHVYTGKIGVVAELNGCMSSLVEKQITVSGAPLIPEINGEATVCNNDNLVTFTVSPNNFPSSAYNWDIRRISDNSSGGATIMEGQLTGNIIVNFGEDDVIISVRENNSECVSPLATKVVSVRNPPQVHLVVTNLITVFDGNDGAIKTEVTGGTQPYATYKLLQTGAVNQDGIFKSLSEGSYSVEVTDAHGCSATSNVVDLDQPHPAINASFTAAPHAACFPVTIYIQNLSTGADTYLWKLYRSGKLITTSNLRSPDFQTSEPGNYDIHLTASNSTTKQYDEFELKGIQVFDVPHAAFELRSEVIYAPDTPIALINFSAGANQYLWDFGDGVTSTEFEPTHQYQKEGRYMLTLLSSYDHGMVDSNGDGTPDQQLACDDSMQKEIVALKGGELKIPNAFTPNTDGPNGGQVTNGSFNDVFVPIGKGITEFKMLIYDRWGSLVFESSDRNIGWDGYSRQGQLMPAGVYIYKVVVRLSNGERISRLGDVTLIR